MNAVLLQLNPENSAVEQIAFWAAPPRRLLLSWHGRCELTADEIQARATTITETLEEILRWHGKHPEAISQFERDQWLDLSERGVHHGGLNE